MPWRFMSFGYPTFGRGGPDVFIGVYRHSIPMCWRSGRAIMGRCGITETAQLAGWAGSSQLVAAAPMLNRDQRLLGAVFTRSEKLPLSDILGSIALSTITLC